MRVYVCGSREHGIWGVRLGRYYATLASPKRWPLYSERNRGKGFYVLPLGRGWRLRLRIDPLPSDQGIGR
jgi:hypothetical protein